MPGHGIGVDEVAGGGAGLDQDQVAADGPGYELPVRDRRGQGSRHLVGVAQAGARRRQGPESLLLALCIEEARPKTGVIDGMLEPGETPTPQIDHEVNRSGGATEREGAGQCRKASILAGMAELGQRSVEADLLKGTLVRQGLDRDAQLQRAGADGAGARLFREEGGGGPFRSVHALPGDLRRP
jgi:hypothetical protein